MLPGPAINAKTCKSNLGVDMRWGDFRRSDNIEDRTDGSMGSSGGGGGGMKIGGLGLIIVVIVSLLFGVNPMQFLGMMDGAPSAPSPQTGAAPGYGPQSPGTAKVAPGQAAQPRVSNNPQKDLVSAVLGDTEDVWKALFQAMGKSYTAPRLVLFRSRTVSGCGQASAASGPFYCPGDQKLYLDTAFFQELQNRFGAPGDFAQAYVIAHEVGHHVQNQFGTMGRFEQQSERMDTRSRNAMSVRLELQADCYAGVWGYFAAKRNLLEPGDVEEGLRAASAVGDDTIQKRSQGYAVPDGFTHGTSAQRQRWFKVGCDSGDPRKCDTFAERNI
jgi:predicted metalloprotease